MPKESFLYPETQPVFDLVEEASRRSGVSRGQSFEDFLAMTVAALSGGQMEEQYLATVKKHSAGKPGKRGCDSIARAFGTLVNAMEETRQDILGDLFQGSITYGEAGQFLTPEPVCQMMARMTLGEDDDQAKKTRKSVGDPCCGSGRMLLAAADIQPHWEFVGQDIDLRCVRMTAINLALRNLYGYVIWGNSLCNDKRLVYRTGFNLQGFIREVPLESCPAPVQQQALSPTPAHQGPSTNEASTTRNDDDSPPRPQSQLRLF